MESIAEKCEYVITVEIDLHSIMRQYNEQLGDRLVNTFERIRGQKLLKQISFCLAEIRSALIEADVAMSAVQSFTDHASCCHRQ